jgi:hypothetical protein
MIGSLDHLSSFEILDNVQQINNFQRNNVDGKSGESGHKGTNLMYKSKFVNELHIQYASDLQNFISNSDIHSEDEFPGSPHLNICSSNLHHLLIIEWTVYMFSFKFSASPKCYYRRQSTARECISAA